MTAQDFGDLIVEEGRFGRLESESRGRSRDTEAAASYDLKQAAAVKAAVDTLARELAKAGAKAPFMSLRTGPDSAFAYDGVYPDLYDLCRRAAADETLGPECRRAATAVGLSR